MRAAELLPLVRVYDLRDPDAQQAARRHTSPPRRSKGMQIRFATDAAPEEP